jgi:hypothetical protein
MLSAIRCRLSVCLLIVHFVVFLSACVKPINLALGQNNKIALYPAPRQHLVWLNGIQVQFLGLSPCREKGDSETGNWISECHVKNNLTAKEPMQFFYICKDYGCSDPEVDVGSGIGVLYNTKPKASDLYNTKSGTSKAMDEVGVYCPSATVKLAPPDLPSASQNAPLKPGVVVNWNSVGGLSDWTVTFDATGVCEEGSIQSKGNTMCTIKQGLTPGKYTYKASSTSCATQAAGSLTTVAP